MEDAMAGAIRRLLIYGGLLLTGPGLAQVAAQTPPPTQPPPATQTAPPLVPPKPAATAPAPKVTVPFPAEARVAYIDMQNIFAESNLGKQGLAQLKALNDKLTAGLAARDKEMQGLSDKIRTQQGIASMQAVSSWTLSLQKLQREAQFAQQEAQVEVDQLKEQLLGDFQARVRPIIDAIRTEKSLWIVFSIDNDTGGLAVASAHPGVDLSDEVTKRLNGTKSN
jgi:Skp family chaperone for outer membrane proteins